MFVASFAHEKFVIGMIVNDLLERKIEVGDQILSIDGQNFTGVNCEKVLNFVYPKEKFTVMHKGLETEIDLKNYQ